MSMCASTGTVSHHEQVIIMIINHQVSYLEHAVATCDEANVNYLSPEINQSINFRLFLSQADKKAIWYKKISHI